MCNDDPKDIFPRSFEYANVYKKEKPKENKKNWDYLPNLFMIR